MRFFFNFFLLLNWGDGPGFYFFHVFFLKKNLEKGA